LSFNDDFTTCMKPLPTPAGIYTSATDISNALKPITSAWRAVGATNGIQLRTLMATVALGIDAGAWAALSAELAAITVAAYVATCAACAVSVAGASVWTAITACDNDDVKAALTLAANNAGVGPVV
jgi:hypothetical protein